MMDRNRGISVTASFRFKSGILLVFSLILLLSLCSFSVSAESIGLNAGGIYYAVLDSYQNSLHWAGLKLLANYSATFEPTEPFDTLLLNVPLMIEVGFPDNQMIDNNYYYAAMMPGTFDLVNVINVTSNDLLAGNMFNSSHFSTFYPGYNINNDDPYDTFCCTLANISIGGSNFSAFRTTLNPATDYYLLKYNDSGSYTPLFLVEASNSTCYNSTSCVGQFMLPISSYNYNFYALNKYPEYILETYIDGVPTTTFEQTALPYNLTVDVRSRLSSQYMPYINVIVGEEDGNNLFIPDDFTGYVTSAFAMGMTDENGRQSFLVAPTAYGDSQTYSLFVGIYNGTLDSVVSRTMLNITTFDRTVFQSKPLDPTTLYENAKVTVNKMNQMVSTLFTWADSNIVKTVTIIHETNTNITQVNGVNANNFSVKTGAPNRFQVYVTTGGISQSGYDVSITEVQGYLVMSPYIAASPLTETNRSHFTRIPITETFFISPTSLYPLSSNITLQIINHGSGAVLKTLNGTIDTSLSLTPSGSVVFDGALKAKVNKINQLLSSLFYSLNN